MVKKIITHLQPDQSNHGRLHSLVKAVAWDYSLESNTLTNPEWISFTHQEQIPTPLRKNPSSSLVESCHSSYREDVRNHYHEKHSALEGQLLSIRPGTKKAQRIQDEINSLDAFLSALDERITLEGPFRPSPYSAYAVYQLNTPPLTPSDKRYIDSSLFNTQFSYQKQVMFDVGFPFTLSTLSGQALETQGHIPLDILLKAPGYAIDFETHNWMHESVIEEYIDYTDEDLSSALLKLSNLTENQLDQDDLVWMNRKEKLHSIETLVNQSKQERLIAAVFCNLDAGQNYLISTLDAGQDVIDIDYPGTEEKVRFELIHTTDQQELIETVNELFGRCEPFYVYGNYQMTFDYGKAEELTGNFRPGVGDTKPHFVAQIPGGFIKQRILPGRCDIDIALYSQSCMPTFNNKLDTVYQHLFGVKAKKTESYADLALKTDRAEQGDTQAALDILYYTGQDGMKSYREGEALKHEHVLKSFLFSSLPARIDATGRKQLTDDFFTRRGWSTTKTVPQPPIKSRKVGDREFADFSGIEYLYSQLETQHVQSGVSDGTLVQIHPFFYAFRPLLLKDDLVQKYYEETGKVDESRKRARLLSELEELAEFPLFMHLGGQERKFAAEFSLSGKGKETYQGYGERMDRSVQYMQRLFTEYSPLNWNGSYVVFPDSFPDDLLERFQEQHIMSVYGTGRFLSGTRGRFAGSIGDELYMRGIADFNSNKGERCPFEKTFYERFLNLVVVDDDIKSALAFVDERAQRLAAQEYLPEEVIYSREAKRDYMDYSSSATQPYIPVMREQKVREGEHFSYTYDLPVMQEKFFGIGTSKKGSLGVLVDWVFQNTRTPRIRSMLTTLYTGNADQSVIEKLFNEYQQLTHH